MRLKYIFTIIFATILLSSCQNNGNIGRLFGTWYVESYTVDGVLVEEVSLSSTITVAVDNITFSFQNDIVNVMAVYDDYQSAYSQFGTWKEEGNLFTLDFTHVDASLPDGGGKYSAPTWLGMISDTPMTMTVSENKGRIFILTWNDPDGHTRVYKLHKTW